MSWRVAVLLGVTALANAGAALAQAELPADFDCGSMTELHGYLGRAQAQCAGLQSNALVARAAGVCATRLGKEKADELLAAGSGNFDRRAEDRGREQACKDAIERHGPTKR
jgi:hypothetical protein